MEVFAVLATLACIAVVILACIKKYNVLMTLLVMGFVGYACATFVTGESVAPQSDGLIWFDVFEVFTSSTTVSYTHLPARRCCASSRPWRTTWPQPRATWTSRRRPACATRW